MKGGVKGRPRCSLDGGQGVLCAKRRVYGESPELPRRWCGVDGWPGETVSRIGPARGRCEDAGCLLETALFVRDTQVTLVSAGARAEADGDA